MARWISLFIVLLFTLPTTAVVLRSGGTVDIGSDEVINDDLVISGGTIRVLGRVTGDLVIAGGNVTVSGPVGGSLMVAAGNVTVNGPVAGSAYLATGNADMSSRVGRNAVVAAGTLNAGSGAAVGRDLAVSSGQATIGGTVTRNVRASAGTLTVTNNARIGGDLIAQTGDPNIAQGAVIQGERRITETKERPHARGAGILGWLLGQLLLGLMLLLVGIIFIAVAPRLTTETVTMLGAHPWASLLTGLIVLLLGPLVILLAFVTIIGIPLGLILLALYMIFVYLSPIFAAIFIGLLILRRSRSLYLALLIGIAILILIRLVPILGFLVTLAALLFGLGAFVLTLQARSANPFFRPREPVEAM